MRKIAVITPISHLDGIFELLLSKGKVFLHETSSKNNVRELFKNNFSIGSHGYNHFWWGKISKKDQEKEIKKSIEFFKKIQVFNQNFSVCLPYGNSNFHTNTILKKYKIKYALTTNVGNINKDNISQIYKIPRFDTNDFK